MASSGNESDADSVESVSLRVARLTHMLAGRGAQLQGPVIAVGQDGMMPMMLDALLVLYDECNTEHLMKNQYIASFVRKYKATIENLRKLRININDFDLKNTIGRGHFGEVQVVREKATSDVYALKVLRKADTLAQQNVAFYEEERDIMAKTSSEWITQLQYAFQDANNLYLVMEFHPGGDLLSLLARYDDTFEESMARFYLAEMVLAVHALHTMGYVHRDVKPENILIDRTGHVKLADFGSACKIADANSSVSNMPVGTPDYICPEVLTKMNSQQGCGKFGEECDWWSLGVCAYEMMFGKTPFTDEKGSMVVTYANIMNFKKCLKFPDPCEVSPHAVDLMKQLLREAAGRLKYEGICAHQFFNAIDFNNIRQSTPPFIPTVTSNDDTSNFDDFDRPRPAPVVEDFKTKTHFSGKDLPFVGFTFTKGITIKERPSLTQEVSSPAAKNSLERRLAQKSQELQCLREKFKSLEQQESSLSVQYGKLKVDLEDRERRLKRSDEERDMMEREMVQLTSEMNGLKRMLELERKERESSESKLASMIKEITDHSEKRLQLCEENHDADLGELQEVIEQLEQEKLTLLRSKDSLQKELSRAQEHVVEKDKKISHLQSRLKTSQVNNKVNTDELEAELSFQERDYMAREGQMKSHLEECQKQATDAMELLKEVRQSKLSLEEKLLDAHADGQDKDQLNRRLSESEEKRKNLEVQVHRISLIERREEQLKEDLKEKSGHVAQLAERIAELETCLHSKELEFKKCEKLYSKREDQLKDKVRELEETLESLQTERSSMEDQSLMLFEEHEGRMLKVQEQESTIVILKSNISTLEDQVEELKTNLEDAMLRARAKRRSTSRTRSLNTLGAQTSPLTPKMKSRRSGFSQTDWVSPQRGSGKIKKSFEIVDEETSRMSGCTQTDWVSPRRGSGKRSSKNLADRSRMSGFTQTETDDWNSFIEAATSPIVLDKARCSMQVQTDSPHIHKVTHSTQTMGTCRVSGGSQTEPIDSPVRRRSSRSKTEVTVSVSFNHGNNSLESGISEETERKESVENLSQTSQRSFNSPCPTEESTNPLDAGFMETPIPEVDEDEDEDRAEESEEEEKWESATEEEEEEEDCFEYETESQEEDLENATEEEEEDLNEGMEDSKVTDESNAPSSKDTTLESDPSPNVTVIPNPEAAENDTEAAGDGQPPDEDAVVIDTVGKEDATASTEATASAAGGDSEVLDLTSCRQSLGRKSRKSSVKECSRKSHETISDLRQEKMYLEIRVENLTRELDQFKESTHQQRIRALDFKHDLREKTSVFDTQLKDLKEQLNQAELSLSEAKETASNALEKEAALKIRSEKLQQQLDESQSGSREKISKLQEERDSLDMQVRTLQNKVTSLEGAEEDLEAATKKIMELAPKIKDLEGQLRQALDDKTKFKLEADKSRDQLTEKLRQCDVLEQRVSQLKVLCSELEKQVQDFEALNEQYEEKQQRWSQDRNTYLTAVDERENEVENTVRQLHQEKLFRQNADEGKKELSKKLKKLQETSHAEVTTLKLKLDKERDKVQMLNSQLTEAEKHGSLLTLDKKSLNKQLEGLNHENVKLKEECSELITKLTEVKSSNLKLSKNLEEAMDRYEMLANQKTDLENQLETMQMDHKHDRYKLGATMNQQSKLIDYLQGQVEHPPKKKRGLFPNRRGDSVSVSIQFRETQHSLEHEREKNSILRHQISVLKDELNQAKTEANRLKTNSLDPRLIQNLVLSPCNHGSPGRVSTATSDYGSQMGTPKTTRRKDKRIKHDIPHRFLTGLNSRPTKCAVCLGSVHFVKQAAKCQECSVVCHPTCAPSLPPTCGMPTEYALHFASILDQAKSISTSRLSTASLQLHMKGWLKVPRPGKQIWEKKWAVLKDNSLHLYTDDTLAEECNDAFDLCPSNGITTVHSAVTAAELTNTASSDLPYILRLEYEPDTTCWPGRSLYLMATTFPEKQRWVGTLEALVDHSDTDKRQEAKMMGNTLLSLSGDQRLEMNCTLPLSKKTALLGADEGLYIMDLTKNKSHYVAQVGDIDSVHQMATLPGLDVIVMITGKDREVSVADLTAAERCASHQATTSLNVRPVPEAVACTTFVIGMAPSGVYLCAALAEKILIMKYNSSQGNFVLKKSLLTATVCSCMYFGEKYVILGTDKFFKIDLHSLTMSELLNKQDTSLAFAAFGAAHFDSFPITVLQMAPVGQPEEFLLCYHEFGVFVDSNGRRSREDDMKWATLPLSFAYREPYLYVIHFNAVQIMEVPSLGDEDYDRIPKTILNIPGPRYLGNALSSEAIYIGSFHDFTSEVICLKGNLASLKSQNKENAGTRASKRMHSRRALTETQVKTIDTDSDSTFQSPPPITPLKKSPSGRKFHSSDNEEDFTSTDATSDTCSLSSY